jgi:hypothetical protein
MSLDLIKDLIEELPFSADIYWLLRNKAKPFNSHFRLEGLRRSLPGICATAQAHAQTAPQGKRIFIFATLHYWIEQAAVIGLTLAGLGHRVQLGYLPYSDWEKPLRPFDLRRQDLYGRDILRPARALIELQSLLDVHPAASLPAAMQAAVELVSKYDVQYTSQTEEVDPTLDLYKLRLERNTRAAQSGLTWLQAGKPDLLVVPNGTILELGVIYQLGRQLDIPVVTYEFNDQKEQIWLAQNDEIMHQNTDQLWQMRASQPLTPEQRTQIETLESARQNGRSFGKSDRLWQNASSAGSSSVRTGLGLDDRPLVLLATNVLGDSLTLGRNLISPSMSDWITRTVQFFARHAEVQFVIRIHPGEQLTHGPSMLNVIRAALPEIPAHIHLVRPEEKVNTYDLIEMTSLGLVYTTTTGLEMAMQGIPVIVAGETHYRNAGFCLAPRNWDEYIQLLETTLADLPNRRLSAEQIELAWNYAWRFFFEFPQPFPWRLLYFWKDYELWPLERILAPEGKKMFGRTFSYLAGEPIEWKAVN